MIAGRFIIKFFLSIFMSSSYQNITFELLDQAAKTPNKSALILTNEEVTYEELDTLVWRVTTMLHEKGVRAGDVVGVLQEQEFLRILSVLGLIRLGATVIPLARSLTSYQRAEISSLVGVRWVLTDFLKIQANNSNILKFHIQDIKNHQKIQYELICKEPKNDCLLVPGSGSTGKQKFIPQSHAILRHRVSIAFVDDGYLSDERVLSLTNLEFASGINRLLSVISIGATFAVFDSPLDSLAEYCFNKKIKTLFGSVFHIESFLRMPRNNPGLLLPGLKALRVSGSSVSMTLRARIRDLINPNLHLVYGANECGRISASVAPKVFEDPFTVGYPLPDVEVEVVDPEGRLLKMVCYEYLVGLIT
jgi:pyochelin synthetase